ncbi:MAG: hypothetical protein AVDCRST_MAG85-1554, partial [uncultured Solirubrobacteraceae bacterium]
CGGLPGRSSAWRAPRAWPLPACSSRGDGRASPTSSPTSCASGCTSAWPRWARSPPTTRPRP